MSEIWRPVRGYETLYEVSNLGNMRKYDSNDLLKVTIDRISGYARISLRVEGNYANKYVHRLVAEAFIKNPSHKPQVHHINEKKWDNREENLMWVDNKEHGKIRSEESINRFRNTYRKNLEKRKNKKDIL